MPQISATRWANKGNASPGSLMTQIVRATIVWLRNLTHRPVLLTIAGSNGSTISVMLTNFINIGTILDFTITLFILLSRKMP